jgi:hypothetical protein
MYLPGTLTSGLDPTDIHHEAGLPKTDVDEHTCQGSKFRSCYI